MSLNIKNTETYQLATELAALTGETMTTAVTVALRERLERTRKRKRKPTVEEMMAIGRQCAAGLKGKKPIDHADFLYDERGLP